MKTKTRENLLGIVVLVLILLGSSEIKAQPLSETFMARDKLAHTLGGVVLYSGSRALLQRAGIRDWRANAGALVFTSVVAFGKEYMDSLDPENHTADPLDAAATIGGGILGVTISIEY